MASEKAQKVIKEHFNELPSVIQDVILNSAWEEKIRLVVKRNNLHIDQGSAIENLVFVTMLGMETPEDFVKNSKEYANVSDEQALRISQEVERMIFKEIREKLIRITESSDTVGDIDRVTDELSQVASDIEDMAKLNVEDGYEKIKAEQFKKKPLAEKIPKGAFDPEKAVVKKPVAPLEAEGGSFKRPEVRIEKKEEQRTFTPTPAVIPKIKEITEIPKSDPIIEEKLGASFVAKKESTITVGDKKADAPVVETRPIAGNYSTDDPYREDIV